MRFASVFCAFLLTACASNQEISDSFPSHGGETIPIGEPIDPALAPNARLVNTGGRFTMRAGNDYDEMEWEVSYQEAIERGIDGNLNVRVGILKYLIDGDGFNENEPFISSAWVVSNHGKPSNIQLDITGLPNQYRVQWFIDAFSEEVRSLAASLELPEGSVETGSRWVPPVGSIPDEFRGLAEFKVDSEVKGWTFENGERLILVETTMDLPPKPDLNNASMLGRGYTLYDPVSYVPVKYEFAAILNFTDNGKRVTARVEQYSASR